MARSSGAARRKAARQTTPASRKTGPARMVFGRHNYVLLLASIGAIVLGFALMAFDNARGLDARGEYFSLDSTLSLTVAPILLMAGYLGLVWAILWRPKDADAETAEEAA